MFLKRTFAYLAHKFQRNGNESIGIWDRFDAIDEFQIKSQEPHEYFPTICVQWRCNFRFVGE